LWISSRRGRRSRSKEFYEGVGTEERAQKGKRKEEEEEYKDELIN